MANPRLYLDAALETGAELELRDESFHYARNVLRLEPGAQLQVFDGRGNEIEARVLSSTKRTLTLLAGDPVASTADQAFEVHLGIGLSRGERMDWVVQKSTELGVASITPLLLTRCNARLDAKRGENRLRHWRQVAISACEQCGRAHLPRIDAAEPLGQWLAQRPELPGLVLHTRDSAVLASSQKPLAMRLLVGPEGGLEAGEFEQARAAGFAPWSLGPRVLRTETAPLAALAILQFLWARQAGD